jgi:hypothetical protein
VAQAPFQIDALQIEPGSGDTLTITRDDDGSLLFVDAVLSSGATLTELAGLGSVTQVLVVGKAGAGAAYTAVQDALDAVPADASPTNPYLVLVLPGVYTETLTVEKDGVVLVGLGRPVLTATTGDVLTVTAAVSTTPESFEIRGFRVEVQEGTKACIQITGGVGSEVLGTRGRVVDCDLVSLGAGGYALKADSINYLIAQGGDWGEGQATTSVRVTDCASVQLHGQSRLPLLQMDNDKHGGDTPFDATSKFVVSGAGEVGDVQATLLTVGSLTLSNCGSVGDVTISGDRTLSINSCNIGDLDLNNSTAASLVGCSRGVAAGAGTLSEPVLTGSVDFTAATSATVAFEVEQPDTSYVVSVEYPPAGAPAGISSKQVSGFDIDLTGAQTTTVFWSVTRGV